MIAGTDPERGAVVDALGAVASHGGPTGLLTALRHAPVEGWSTLAGRMAATAGLDVRYGAEVRSVRSASSPLPRRAGGPPVHDRDGDPTTVGGRVEPTHPPGVL